MGHSNIDPSIFSQLWLLVKKIGNGKRLLVWEECLIRPSSQVSSATIYQSLWCPFCFWKSLYNIFYKTVRAENFITLITPHQIFLFNLFFLPAQQKILILELFLFQYWANEDLILTWCDRESCSGSWWHSCRQLFRSEFVVTNKAISS